MKRVIPAVLLSLHLIAPQPASANYCWNCVQQGTFIAEASRQLAQITAQYQQLQATFAALTRVTNLGSAVAALQDLAIRQPLPADPVVIQGLLNGGGATGMRDSTVQLYNRILGANRVYETPGDTALNRQLDANTRGLAGAQALSLQLYQAGVARQPYLDELRLRIDTAADPSEREALIARLNAEQISVQVATLQAISLGNYIQVQFRVREQQKEEGLQQSLDRHLSRARARGDW